MKKLITILLLSLCLNAFSGVPDSTVIKYEYYQLPKAKKKDKTLLNVAKNVGIFAIGCIFMGAIAKSEFKL